MTGKGGVGKSHVAAGIARAAAARGQQRDREPTRLGPVDPGSRRCVGDQEPGGDRDQRDAEEHPAPADGRGDLGRERGTHEGGQHPRGGEHGEHARSQLLRVGLRDHDVERDAEHAAAVAVDEAPEQEDGHRRRESGDHDTGAEDEESPAQRRARAAPVDLGSRSRERDDGGRERSGEGDGVPAQSVEVVGHVRHDRGDRQRLEGEEEIGRAHV